MREVQHTREYYIASALKSIRELTGLYINRHECLREDFGKKLPMAFIDMIYDYARNTITFLNQENLSLEEIFLLFTPRELEYLRIDSLILHGFHDTRFLKLKINKLKVKFAPNKNNTPLTPDLSILDNYPVDTLDLSNNTIENYVPSNMKFRCRELNVSLNNMKDLRIFENFEGESLDLSMNRFSLADEKPSSPIYFRCKKLNLGRNRLDDIDFLGHTEFEELNLERNFLMNVDRLASFNGEKLNLNHNPIKCMKSFRMFPGRQLVLEGVDCDARHSLAHMIYEPNNENYFRRKRKTEDMGVFYLSTRIPMPGASLETKRSKIIEIY